VPEDQPKPKFDFSTTDWSQRDIAIAKTIGCTREYVRQMRASLGHPKLNKHIRAYQEFTTKFAGQTLVEMKDLQAAFQNTHESTLKKYCRKAGIRIRPKQMEPKIHPWGKMNWQLPNLLISEIWGIRQAVVGSRRYLSGIPSASWRYANGVIPAEHQPAVEAEKLAAASHKSN